MLLVNNKKLPIDISNKIFTYINLNSIKVLNNLKYLIYPNYKKKLISIIEHIASSRIKIFILIMLNYHTFKKFIIKKLSRYFGKSYNSDDITCFLKIQNYKKKYASMCILYLPQIPNGICRICNNFSNNHPFSEYFINKYYCSFLY